MRACKRPRYFTITFIMLLLCSGAAHGENPGPVKISLMSLVESHSKVTDGRANARAPLYDSF